MKPLALYNEIDPGVAAWLRELIAQGLIAPGVVDERSITDLTEDDLAGYTQVHLFAGIGGWSLALRLAGWPDDRPVWTGSAPCQPWSSAGQRRGEGDERDLWPEMLRLIKACKPPVVFGEQVASSEVVGSKLEASFVDAIQGGDFARANLIAKRLAQSPSFGFSPRWLSRVSAGLEEADYALWCSVLGAHSVRSPHIRQRLYWLAYPGHQLLARGGQGRGLEATERGEPSIDTESGGVDGGLGDSILARPQGHAGYGDGGRESGRLASQSDGSTAETGGPSRLEHSPRDGRGEWRPESGRRSVASGCEPSGMGNPAGRRDGTAALTRGDSQSEGVRRECGAGGSSDPGGVALPAGRQSGYGGPQRGGEYGQQQEDGGAGGGVADAAGLGRKQQPSTRPSGILTEASIQNGQQHQSSDHGAGANFWSSYELIPCRDGKLRRIPGRSQSIFLNVLDGVPRLMGSGWDGFLSRIKEEVINYGKTVESRPIEALQAMWSAVAEASICQLARMPHSVSEAGILLIAMCELARNPKFRMGTTAQNIAAISEGTMRALWPSTRQLEVSSCPSHQRKLAGSSNGESSDVVCRVSFGQDAPQGPSQVPSLRPASPPKSNVSEALSKVEEIWRSLPDKGVNGKGRFYAGASAVIAAEGHPLAKGVKNRVGLLKGAGNAILPELGAQFIRAFKEVIG